MIVGGPFRESHASMGTWNASTPSSQGARMMGSGSQFGYSDLRAGSGLMCAARRTGINVAATVTRRRQTSATVNEAQSVGATPNSSRRSSRAFMYAPANPIAAPSNVSLAASLATSCAMFAAVRPSARDSHADFLVISLVTYTLFRRAPRR